MTGTCAVTLTRPLYRSRFIRPLGVGPVEQPSTTASSAESASKAGGRYLVSQDY